MASMRMTSRFKVNPARAGMILPCACISAMIRCKPRASGDDPVGVAGPRVPVV